jgi:hypothetical protein
MGLKIANLNMYTDIFEKYFYQVRLPHDDVMWSFVVMITSRIEFLNYVPIL